MYEPDRPCELSLDLVSLRPKRLTSYTSNRSRLCVFQQRELNPLPILYARIALPNELCANPQRRATSAAEWSFAPLNTTRRIPFTCRLLRGILRQLTRSSSGAPITTHTAL